VASNKNLFLYLVFLVVGLCVAYSGALEVPFYLDDRSSITHNPYFEDGSVAFLFEIYGMRGVGYVSFWLNYLYNANEPSGYHLVNLVIHLLNSFLVCCFVSKLLKLTLPEFEVKIPLLVGMCAGLLFLLHPLNSQSAIYIAQRLSSLVTFFYLVSLLSYLNARTSQKQNTCVIWIVVCLLSAALALFTKQNAVTLPVAILLFEIVLFRTIKLRYPLLIAGLLVCSYIIGLNIFDEGSLLHKIDDFTRESDEYSRWEYLLVQSSIITLYLQKFFIPINLHLDYGLSLSAFSEFQKISALVIHSCLIVLALIFRRKMPLLSLSVLLFYLLHVVESGVIPITDLVFEHRTYLPNVAILLFLSALVTKFIPSSAVKAKHYYQIAIPTLILAFACLLLTKERVNEWQDPKTFYTKELERSPKNVRTLHNFAEYLIREGNMTSDKIRAGVLLDSMYENSTGKLDAVMVNTHLVYLMGTKEYNKARKLGEGLLQQQLHPLVQALVKENLGVIYTTLGNYQKAIEMFGSIPHFDKTKPSSRIAYSFALYRLNNKPLALQVAQSILTIDPNNEKAKELIQLIQTR